MVSDSKFVKSFIHLNRIIWATLILSLVLTGVSADTRSEPKPPVSIYAGLLARHVHMGEVDYRGFKQEEALLDRFLSEMATLEPDRWTADYQKAFYINLYNAWTIKLILTRYPDISSIKDLGSLFKSPWKRKIVQIHGDTVTLDYIEHEILRPRFKDPRIHFAINCASKSCPPLLNEPYGGPIIEDQLDSVTRHFINDPKSNYLQDGVLNVSRIFKWFDEDFPHGVLAFIKTHATGELKQRLASQPSPIKIEYLTYDWSLNGH